MISWVGRVSWYLVDMGFKGSDCFLVLSLFIVSSSIKVGVFIVITQVTWRTRSIWWQIRVLRIWSCWWLSFLFPLILCLCVCGAYSACFCCLRFARLKSVYDRICKDFRLKAIVFQTLTCALLMLKKIRCVVSEYHSSERLEFEKWSNGS